jgi:hypothetical protein
MDSEGGFLGTSNLGHALEAIRADFQALCSSAGFADRQIEVVIRNSAPSTRLRDQLPYHYKIVATLFQLSIK